VLGKNSWMFLTGLKTFEITDAKRRYLGAQQQQHGVMPDGLLTTTAESYIHVDWKEIVKFDVICTHISHVVIRFLSPPAARRIRDKNEENHIPHREQSTAIV
jgi:hypothetical protein